MKKSLVSLITITSLLIGLTISSCKNKIVDDELVGKWQLISERIEASVENKVIKSKVTATDSIADIVLNVHHKDTLTYEYTNHSDSTNINVTLKINKKGDELHLHAFNGDAEDLWYKYKVVDDELIMIVEVEPMEESETPTLWKMIQKYKKVNK